MACHGCPLCLFDDRPLQTSTEQQRTVASSGLYWLLKANMASHLRSMCFGVLTNQPTNMFHLIEPKSKLPEMGFSEHDGV